MTPNAVTRIQPVGTYNPVDGVCRWPSATPTPVAQPVPPASGAPKPAHGGFFHDVWDGAKTSVGNDVSRVLHPVKTAKAVLDGVKHPGQGLQQLTSPYANDLKTGHPGEALGRVLGHVGLLGGLFLGARALLGLGSGGGASVGLSSPIGEFFANAGHAIGNVLHGGWNLVTAPFRWVSGALGGGGAHVGF